MGESIAEATITKWLKEVGDSIEIDESIVEIATDKVDSDVPSEHKGKLVKKNFEVNDVVKVGDIIAKIETESILEDFDAVISDEQIDVENKNINENFIEEDNDINISEIPSIELIKEEEKKIGRAHV